MNDRKCQQVFEKKCEVKFAAEPKQTCANVPEQKCRTVAHTIFDTGGRSVLRYLSQCTMLKNTITILFTVYETKVEQHCRTLSVPECDTVVVTKIESVPDKECGVVQVVIVIFKPFSVRALV